MKICWIGHYRESSGWGQTTIDHILALDEAGYDVVCRPIRLNEVERQVPQRILELEDKSDKNCDVLIQHLLPQNMEYNGNFKNIGIYYSETDNLPVEWAEKIQLMDELWVPNTSMVYAAQKAGVTKPVHVVKPPINTSKYEQTYQPIESLRGKLAGGFSFLFLGDLSRRKNLATILKSFHTEFHPSENVNLVIKPTKFNTSPQELESIVRKMSEEIRLGLKLYPNPNDYKPEIIITDKLSEEDILRLHSTTDCFVSACYGEAVGLGIIDSMGLGKLTIANEVGLARDILCGYNQYDMFANSLTISQSEQILEPVFGMIEGFPYLFSGRENWWQPSTTALMNRMRAAFEMDQDYKDIIGKDAIKTVYGMSYENFAKRVGELLNV